MFSDSIQLGSILGIGTIITTVVASTWKLRDWIQKGQKDLWLLFKGHEEMDQKRHEQNIEKFSQLQIRLARMDALLGFNGTYKSTIDRATGTQTHS